MNWRRLWLRDPKTAPKGDRLMRSTYASTSERRYSPSPEMVTWCSDHFVFSQSV